MRKFLLLACSMLSMATFAQGNANDFYFLGFNGDFEKSQNTMFLKEVVDGTKIGYSYPRFPVTENTGTFFIQGEDGTVFGYDPFFGNKDVYTQDQFAILFQEGTPFNYIFEPGYYSFTFTEADGMGYFTFTYCTSQTPIDEEEYYLIGFNGIDTPDESMKFERKMVDIDGSSEITQAPVYVLEKVYLSSCPDGFYVTSYDIKDTEKASDGFYFGVDSENPDPEKASDSWINYDLGRFGKPVAWDFPEGEYNVNFTVTDTSAYIRFYMPVDEPEDGVESVTGVDGQVEYFNIQGMKVNSPDKGIYIKKQGSRLSKVAY